MRVVVIFLLIALVNASSQLHEQETNKQELNPANDVETIDVAKQQKKRTLLGVGPYAYAAKHVGVHPLGFKYILGYGPIGYTPYARPVTLLKPLLHTHGWKPIIPVHAVHSVPIKPLHVKPVVPIVPVPHFKPAHHHPHVHVHHHQPVQPHVHTVHPVVPVQPHVHTVHPVVPIQPDEPHHHHHHVHTVHPHVHPVQPVVPVQPAQPEEPIEHHVHTIQPVQPVQPVVPVQPVQPIVPVEKPVVPATIVPNIIKPVLQPQLPQLPYGYPFFKPLAIPNQIYPVQPSVVQQYVPQLHFQPPVVQPLPQPPNVQPLLPPNPLVRPYVPQVPFQPPVVHAVPQPPPVVQHLLPQPPPVVQHLLPQPPPVVQHLLPQPPPVQHLLPQPPPVQPLVPQPLPAQPFVPQPPPVVQHLLPQLPPQPSIFHIFKQFPFFKHVTPLLPVNPPAQGPAPELPQAPVPPVTVHSPSNTHGSGVSVQIPLHLPEHPNFRPGVNIIPQFPAQPDSSDQDGHGQVPVDQPDFHHEQGGHADNPFIIPQPQPHVPTTHPAPQTPLYLPPHPLLRPGLANPGDSSNSVQTEFSSTFPRHQFVGQGTQEIHHPSISLEPPYGPEHNLG